jgi:hypothetical protein
MKKEWQQLRKRDAYAAKEMASMVKKRGARGARDEEERTRSRGGQGEEEKRRSDAFLLLYENLDDYTLHLFEATWPTQVREKHVPCAVSGRVWRIRLSGMCRLLYLGMLGALFVGAERLSGNPAEGPLHV